MRKRLKATVVFSGDLDPDPAAAAAALGEAGYEVVTLLEKVRSHLQHIERIMDDLDVDSIEARW